MDEKPMIVAGRQVAFGERLESRNPWSGEVLGSIPLAADENIETALNGATAAWENPPPLDERIAVCKNVADAIKEKQSQFVDLLIRETGKPKQFAIGEVERMERTFRLASQAGDEMQSKTLDLGFDPRGKDFEGTWQRFPVGPIIGFVPYNWPLNLAAHKLAPAIVAGCPVIMKVSQLAPLCTLALGETLLDSGMQPQALSILHLTHDQAQRILVDPRIKMLSFTGSPAVGWMLKEKVPRKRVLLELGGNAPVIVCEDADLELAATRTAISGYGYAGQVCISAQNVFVHQSVHETLLELLARKTQTCKTGDPSLEETVCGPLIDENAKSKVVTRIANSGATVVARAGAPDHPLVVPPTLLADVPKNAEVFCEEIFGPVLNVVPYENLQQLFAELNAGKYRLHASIFTNNTETAERAFQTLRYGGVIVNESPSLRFDNMPYGGEGDSGFGREGVRFAIEEMTVPRTNLARQNTPK